MGNGKGGLVMVAGATLVAVAASLVLPPEAYLALAALVCLAAMGAVALSLQVGKPFLGLLLLVATAVAFPLEFRGPTGVMMGSSYPLSALLCSVWLLRFLLSRTQSLDSSRIVYAAFAFIGITLLSFAMGQFPWFPSSGAPVPAQVAELGIFLLSALLFLMVGHQVQTMAQLKWLTWILLATGLVACLVQMVPGLVTVGRMTTRPGSVGSLFWTWLVAVSFSQALFNRTLPSLVRVGMLGITGLVLFHGLVQVRSWASGWVPALAAMGVIALFRAPRLTLTTGLVAVPAILLIGGDVAADVLAEESYSLMTRQEAWISLWQLVEMSPLLGTGPANYYYFTENLPILGWYVRFISHNNYQDLLVQTGFLGLLGFLWFSLEALLLGVRLFRQVPAGFAQAYAVGVIGGLVGSLLSGMLGDWIIPFYYNAGILGFRSSLLFWVFLGGALALKRILRASRDAAAVAPAYAVRAYQAPVYLGRVS
jgi:hypothetical protein